GLQVRTAKIAIVGAGPYGLSLAAHLSAHNVPHRIFGHPMSFWVKIAEAGGKRFLKSYCFGTNISTPVPGFNFADYSEPRGLETFEPCTMYDFASYGLWFQRENVGWVENARVTSIVRLDAGFAVNLDTGDHFAADSVVISTGLSNFAHIPDEIAS